MLRVEGIEAQLNALADRPGAKAAEGVGERLLKKMMMWPRFPPSGFARQWTRKS